MLITTQIAVAHQLHIIAIDFDDTMDDIPTAVNPGQDHVAHLHTIGLHQFDAVHVTHDER